MQNHWHSKVKTLSMQKSERGHTKSQDLVAKHLAFDSLLEHALTIWAHMPQSLNNVCADHLRANFSSKCLHQSSRHTLTNAEDFMTIILGLFSCKLSARVIDLHRCHYMCQCMKACGPHQQPPHKLFARPMPGWDISRWCRPLLVNQKNSRRPQWFRSETPAQKVRTRSRAVSTQGSWQVCFSWCRKSELESASRFGKFSWSLTETAIACSSCLSKSSWWGRVSVAQVQLSARQAIHA